LTAKSRDRKTGGESSSWAGLEKHADLILFSILYLAILYVFRASVFQGRTTASADAVAQAAVFGKFALREIFEHHRYPLWFPHIFCGMPFFASMSWVEVYPPAVIMRFLGHYLGFGFILSNSLHFLLGGIAVFYVGRNFKLGRIPSFVAAVSFVFSTGMITMEHGTRIITAMYLPLVFLLTKKAVEERKIRMLLWAGVAAGFQILANHIQIVFYTWILIGLYLLYYWIVPGLFSRPSRKLPEAVGRVLLIAALAAVTGAVLLTNLKEYAPYSARSFSVGTAEGYRFATSWSFPPFELLEFLLPSIAGFGGRTYWGGMPFTHAPYYMGVMVLVLVSAAVVFKRGKDVWFLVFVALVAILLSFGKNFDWLYGVVYNHVPFFNKLRIPVLILVVAVFSISLLAGFGTELLLGLRSPKSGRSKRPDRGKRIEILLLVWFIFCLAVPFYLTLARETFVDAAVHETTDQGVPVTEVGALKASRYRMALDDSWRSFGFLSAGSLVLLLFLRGRIGKFGVSILIVLLIVLDLVLIAGRVIHPQFSRADIDKYYEREGESPVVKFLQSDSTLFRILPLGQEMTTNKYAYFGISSVSGYHAAKMGLYDRMTRELGFPRSIKLLDLMNVKYVISPSEIRLPVFKPVLNAPAGRIYENRQVLPRFFTVDSVVVVSDPESSLEEMKKPRFDPGEYAVAVALENLDLEKGARAELAVKEYDIHRIDLTAEASGRCFLVMSETYYPPGWRAFVDGREVQILQTDYMFRGLPLDRGRHEVVLKYNTGLFKASLQVTVWSVIALLLALVAETFVRRRRGRAG